MKLLDVEIPANALDQHVGIAKSTTAMLRDLYLLGDLEKESSAAATLTGPPQSIAVIEAGATAMSKWWAAGGATLIAAAWGWAGSHWPTEPATQRTVILSLGVLSAALVLAIGFLLGSDVRARGAAAIATINARAKVAGDMINASVLASQASVVPLTSALAVQYTHAASGDESGWQAIAVQALRDGHDDQRRLKVLLHKGNRNQWVPESDIAMP